MNKKIFVIGSINTDLVITAPYMPASGETIAGSDFFSAHGGKGANQAVAAARLGGEVYMCGCVGDDDFGREAVAALARDGVDTSGTGKIGGISSGIAVIVITSGDNRIIVDGGANQRLSDADVEASLEKAEAGDILLAQLECPVSVVGYAMRRAKEKGMYCILNPAPATSEKLDFLEYCDLFVPNETEAAAFGGREAIMGKIGGKLITTLGEKGFEIADKNEIKTYPCIKIKPVDTTAAGDTFCGGLAARLAAGATLEEAAKFGSLAASIACTRAGAQPSIPSFEEVQRAELSVK